MAVEHWQKLTITPTSVLNATIVELHHASQLIAAVGNSLLPKEKDDSQSNLGWDNGQQALVGREINLNQKIRPLLKYNDLSIHILNEQEELLQTFSLPGNNKNQALLWLNQALQQLGHHGQEVALPDHYELPASPFLHGAIFSSRTSYRLELARYRRNTQLALQAIAEVEKLSEIRTWPHHFDMASQITIDEDENGNPTKTIGLGLAIPDSISHELYYYVSHWLKDGVPNYRSLPALPGDAIWLTKGFKGVILPVSSLVKLDTKKAQSELLDAFFREAIAATKQFF